MLAVLDHRNNGNWKKEWNGQYIWMCIKNKREDDIVPLIKS